MTRRFAWSIACSMLVCAPVSGEDEKPKAKPRPVVAAQAAGGATLVRVVTAPTKEQQAAAQKTYKEAAEAAEQAAKALIAAAKAATSQNPRERVVEGRRLAEAKAKLETALKAVEARRVLVTRATALRVSVAQRSQATVPGVREKVDREDNHERFLLLVPGGPLVVGAQISVDGKPFRTAREDLIDEMLATATDDEGKTSWEAALKSPRFTLGRVTNINESTLKNYVTRFDRDKDGLVNRLEARYYLATMFQGPTFSLLTGSAGAFGSAGGVVVVNGRAMRGGDSTQADVRKLLDTDNDGLLSDTEIAAASERLKTRDADDNDLLYPAEISGTSGATGNRAVNAARGRVITPRAQVSVLLGPAAQAAPLFAAITQKYGDSDGNVLADSFSSFPGLFESLDGNKDGKLQQGEVLALNKVKPHLQLSIQLGKSDGPALTVTSMASELVKSGASDDSLSIELPGVKLAFKAPRIPAQSSRYAQLGTSYLTRFDANKNGYLEKDEVQGGFARQFALWDMNSDGKVFAKEIVEAYTRMQAPQQSQIRATAAKSGNPLFQAIDRSGDGRLSLREMRTAQEKIREFDENKDGQISNEEIPISLAVNFGRGNSGFNRYQVLSAQGRVTQAGSPPNNNGAPEWFTRMDRNGDGDITMKEFLGTKEDFQKLDTNNDSFIEPAEAKPASE
jgi:Ca2+-binding EF-hand superfamily protein